MIHLCRTQQDTGRKDNSSYLYGGFEITLLRVGTASELVLEYQAMCREATAATFVINVSAYEDVHTRHPHRKSSCTALGKLLLFALHLSSDAALLPTETGCSCL